MITFSDLGTYSRLGNQLFQLSFLYSIAKKINTKIFLKGYLFNDPTVYEYKETVVRFFKNINSNENIIWINEEGEYEFLYKKHIKTKYLDPNFSFTHILEDNCDYSGYYQSEKYFLDYKEDILNLFSSINESDVYKKYKEIILNTKNSLSLHIRRGDYLQNQNFTSNLANTNYYNNSYDYLKNRIDLTNIFIFSDDIKFCVNFLKQNDIFQDKNLIFVENLKNYEDLMLQSYCENNIIANSTFSWWGAWLKNSNKNYILCPEKWFGLAGPQDQDDICPQQWVKIKL